MSIRHHVREIFLHKFQLINTEVKAAKVFIRDAIVAACNKIEFEINLTICIRYTCCGTIQYVLIMYRYIVTHAVNVCSGRPI